MKQPLPDIRTGRVLVDGVTNALREAILGSYFEPGEKLDQDLIARELKVSRTPIREALRMLESEGFVEVRPHYGAFITSVTPRDIREVYEIRQLLEAEIVRQATLVIPDDVLAELDASLRSAQAKIDAGDTSKYDVSDLQFHNVPLDYFENGLLKDVLNGLNNRIRMVRLFALRQPGPHIIESQREHRAILDAMRRRDAAEAARLMSLHLRNSALRIQEMASRESSGVDFSEKH